MSARPARILTIDDEDLVREVITAYLEDSGFEVIQAGDGQTGINLICRELPDLVLCDLRMPGMDGLQVLATVTRDFPELPILVVSGLGGMSDAIQALKLGAWDYVTKPIEDMAVLEYAINHALERARLRRENREHREHLEAINEQLQQTLRRLQEDETAARRIQFQLLPENDKAYRNYRFSRHLLTSQYLSGDFVDYFAIEQDRKRELAAAAVAQLIVRPVDDAVEHGQVLVHVAAEDFPVQATQGLGRVQNALVAILPVQLPVAAHVAFQHHGDKS